MYAVCDYFPRREMVARDADDQVPFLITVIICNFYYKRYGKETWRIMRREHLEFTDVNNAHWHLTHFLLCVSVEREGLLLCVHRIRANTQTPTIVSRSQNLFCLSVSILLFHPCPYASIHVCRSSERWMQPSMFADPS